MRRGLIAVVLLAALAAMAPAGMAQERPLAALVPADVGSYSELNLDRLLAKTSDMTELRDAFANMQALKVAAKVVAADPDAKRIYDQVMQVASDLSAALGPSIGWGFWMPDLQGMMGAIVSGGTEGGGMPGMPQLLLVAQVRDSEKLERSLSFIIEKAHVPADEAEERNGVKVTPIAQGQVALARGNGWLALSWPADLVEKMEARAAGAAGGSLADDPAYQRAMAWLPKDAVMVQYTGPQTIKQLVAAATAAAPSASFPPPGEDGIALAMGLRVEEVQGRKLVTAYYTSELSAFEYLVDLPLSLEAGMLGPVLAKSRQEAPKAQCLSNVENIAMAMQMFSVDNGKFPSADKWVDQIKPYLANDAVLKCPEDKSSARCSYGMNKALSKKAVKKIKNPSAVVAIYETAHPGKNPSGGAKDVVSPPRHPGGSNFGYADGHGEWKSADEEVKF
jgi:prepilin-type processing-associated H-X9-DG protein